MRFKDGSHALVRTYPSRRLSNVSLAFIFIVSSYVFWTTYPTLPRRSENESTSSAVSSRPKTLSNGAYGPAKSSPLPYYVSPAVDSPAIAPSAAEQELFRPKRPNIVKFPPNHLPPPSPSPSPLPESITTTLVIGHLQAEAAKVAWTERLPDIDRRAFYVVDDPSAPLHLPVNHGRESMVYLRYIIDHYDNLTDVTVFMHPHEKAWHNNLLLRRNATETLTRLNRSYILQTGYLNTRCDLYPGCPRWIHLDPTPEEHRVDPARVMDMFTTKLWLTLFPDSPGPAPEWLSAPCCSQFAASRAAIQAVPRSAFVRIADWLASEDLDMYTGRVLEVLWHYIFTGRGEECPAAAQCYCSAYGVCFEDDGKLDRWAEAGLEESLAGTRLQQYDREKGGGKIGDELEKIVGHDPEHLRLVKAAQDARKERMDREGEARVAHAIAEL